MIYHHTLWYLTLSFSAWVFQPGHNCFRCSLFTLFIKHKIINCKNFISFYYIPCDPGTYLEAFEKFHLRPISDMVIVHRYNFNAVHFLYGIISIDKNSAIYLIHQNKMHV